MITLTINNKSVEIEAGTTVAAAILNADFDGFRRAVSGEVRGPLCGMGICFECRVTIDGISHQRSCNVLVRNGMKIDTDG